MAEIRREFGGGDEESVKVAKLKKIEQGGRTMEEFVQDFKRTAMSRSLTVDSILFSLSIFILLYFSFLFTFLFLEQLGLGLIGHAVTSVTS